MKYLILALALVFLPVRAEPVVVPPNTPFVHDQPLVVMELEEFKELAQYVGNLERAVKACGCWKSQTESQEVPNVAPRKED